MPKISKQKEEKIQEQILHHLFTVYPKQIFTSDIAKELARDEEFIKKLVTLLLKKELVVQVSKNPKGFAYTKRSRWRLSNKAHAVYSQYQKNQKTSSVVSDDE